MNDMSFKPKIWTAKLTVMERAGEAQTRRLDGLKEINQEPDKWTVAWSGIFIFEDKSGQKLNVKPRYQVGEVVYIKELWATESLYNWCKPSEIPNTARIFYLSDGHDYRFAVGKWRSPLFMFAVGKWRSPLFMPAWAARRFVQVTKIGIGRLQNISWEDCLLEGIKDKGGDNFYSPETPNLLYSVPQGAYAKLWDSVYPKYPWAINPWEFTYTLKLVPRPEEK